MSGTSSVYHPMLDNLTARLAKIVKRIRGEARLTVQDQGEGFELPADPASLSRAGHYGLANMRERANKVVQGSAVFREGEEVVVFLNLRAPSVFGVERLALGKFAVGAPAGLPKRAVRDRSGLSCAGCGADEHDDLSLDGGRTRAER